MNEKPQNFADMITDRATHIQSALVAGLDPTLDSIPEVYKRPHKTDYATLEELYAATAFVLRDFNIDYIEAAAPHVLAFKPQVAYYENLGPAGMQAYKDTIDECKRWNIPVIGDVKRNDIGSTAEQYAEGWMGKIKLLDGETHKSLWDVDAVTMNGYLGDDGVDPFSKAAVENGKGFFGLVKTSNPSSGQLQDKRLARKGSMTIEGYVYEEMARILRDSKYADAAIGELGLSSIGAVVGATYPQQMEAIRKILPNNLFLIPGYGTQGGKAKNLTAGFLPGGRGALVNSSRDIMNHWMKKDLNPLTCTRGQFMDSIRERAEFSKNDINAALDADGVGFEKR